MVVRKKNKENVRSKKVSLEGSPAEENLQSLRSWIQKIEQTTTSVSSRLSAVEKRLSEGRTEHIIRTLSGMNDSVEAIFADEPNRNTTELVSTLDGKLHNLHTTIADQKQEADTLKEQMHELKTMNTQVRLDLEMTQTTISEMHTALEHHMKNTEHHKPFVMHVGALKIPIEFTGIIGGLLAFTITILVLINHKEILLSPVFLVLVGILFLGSALVKMVRLRPQTLEQPSFSSPLITPMTQVNAAPSKRKEG
ncbi:MAG: hypothetical protein BV458_04820 [Thermoplasmata archaeon M9B2D]|nr:MAG: hypothetical protein BV458_04820 [Thermoplasmata archaeon M9B2D]